MPGEIKIKSIRSSLPVRYRYSPFIRIFMLAFACLVFAYTLYFLLAVVNADTPMFFKLLPLGIMFVCLDSILRQVTSLNSVIFLQDSIRFTYMAKKNVEIPYDSIISLDLFKHITYYMHLRYRDADGHEQLFKTPASFPKVLEIILNIADLAPNVKVTGILAQAVEHLREQAKAENEQQI